jgi:hypothetical protein
MSCLRSRIPDLLVFYQKTILTFNPQDIGEGNWYSFVHIERKYYFFLKKINQTAKPKQIIDHNRIAPAVTPPKNEIKIICTINASKQTININDAFPCSNNNEMYFLIVSIFKIF